MDKQYRFACFKCAECHQEVQPGDDLGLIGLPFTLETIFGEITRERFIQDAKWGIQCHGDERWLTILLGEVGECAKAILEGSTPETRKELLQVAAVSIAWLECIYRRTASVPRKEEVKS
jgi:hypothetical protein